MPGDTRPKRTKTEREEALAQVAMLDKRGWNQYDIARRLGVSQGQVSYDLKIVRKRYREVQLQEIGDKVALAVMQYQEIMREAWEAWERSKLDAMKTVTEETLFDDEVRTKLVKYVEGRLPGAEYLRTVLGCLQAIRELEGLDKPKESLVSTVTATIPFDEIMKRADAKRAAKSIEEKLAQAEKELLPKLENKNKNALHELPPTNGVNGSNHDSVSDSTNGS